MHPRGRAISASSASHIVNISVIAGSGEQATATPLAEAIRAFVLRRQALGATVATLRTYTRDLLRFAEDSGAADLADLTPATLDRYLAELRQRMKPISAHRHYRALRTFCRWCVRTGRLAADPMADLVMRVPKTLPRVPDDEAVRRLMLACPDTPEGRRNRAMIVLLADSGLRKEELRCLRVEDVDFRARQLRVHQGKGQRDRVGLFGDATASALRSWLAVHPDPRPEAFLFARKDGEPLGVWAVVRILHRLSRRAKLTRPIGPHALRHYCATELLRRTGDLELVRRVLGHSTLAMALRYAALTQAEIAAKFATVSPMDQLWGRSIPVRHNARKGVRV